MVGRTSKFVPTCKKNKKKQQHKYITSVYRDSYEISAANGPQTVV